MRLSAMLILLAAVTVKADIGYTNATGGAIQPRLPTHIGQTAVPRWTAALMAREGWQRVELPDGYWAAQEAASITPLSGRVLVAGGELLMPDLSLTNRGVALVVIDGSLVLVDPAWQSPLSNRADIVARAKALKADKEAKIKAKLGNSGNPNAKDLADALRALCDLLGVEYMP